MWFLMATGSANYGIQEDQKRMYKLENQKSEAQEQYLM